ncbi:MAG: hypothetical protein KC910_24360, partial [Candidatus Eremiobacteraeota bacterium]|nr:hypothetical protein [Candidatus Eremiobacteraeota bacterium]
VADSMLTAEQREAYAQTKMFKSANTWPGSEVRTLVSQGPSENRIDLTIVGDGYTEAEKCKFFEDAKRLTDDMFVGHTFASYLPLFNVHAVFVPSHESGLTDVEEKDTALGLYRSPQGSKRGIMPGNYSAAERAINLAPDTDYPILVANDDFYGGLGGRYAITTRSHNSGTMVLRHELGHNFGNVGEEYDGGQVYSGANHSHSSNVPWDQWVNGELKVESAQCLATSYPWKNLAEGPVQVNLNVPEGDQKGPRQIGIDISSVGWETRDDVKILIDGEEQKYEGVYTNDRSFFRLNEAKDLSPGRHVLEIRQNVEDGDNVLAAVRVNAYPADYDFTADKVGAFPSFNYAGRMVGYRPTHESCLMRNMRSTKFCEIDQENMWHQFLNRIDLIDDIKVTTLKGKDGEDMRQVKLETPNLEGLTIKWYGWKVPDHDPDQPPPDPVEVELEQLQGQTTWIADPGDRGQYRAEVSFATDEVRNYSDRFHATRTVTV